MRYKTRVFILSEPEVQRRFALDAAAWSVPVKASSIAPQSHPERPAVAIGHAYALKSGTPPARAATVGSDGVNVNTEPSVLTNALN